MKPSRSALHMLDELRLLLNLETPRGKLLQIILAGQTKLEEKLRRPELRQLRQRVMFHCKLTTLSEEQTAAYVQTRLPMPVCRRRIFFFPKRFRAFTLTQRVFPASSISFASTHLSPRMASNNIPIAAEAIQRIAADFDLSANPISVEDEFSGSRLGRFQMFSVAEAKLDAACRSDEPPPVAASPTMGVEPELAEMATSSATPQFIRPELPDRDDGAISDHTFAVR